jgi:hypothetical protein
VCVSDGSVGCGAVENQYHRPGQLSEDCSQRNEAAGPVLLQASLVYNRWVQADFDL